MIFFFILITYVLDINLRRNSVSVIQSVIPRVKGLMTSLAVTREAGVETDVEKTATAPC